VALLLALLLAFLLVAPFFYARRGPHAERWMPVPNTHDMRQHLSVQRQLDAAVRTGELYPRWQPEFNNGYGLPWLNYYPPGFYWFTEPIYLAVRDVLDAVFLATLAMMAASGLAAYALARRFFSRPASVAAAAFYMITPYHGLDLYWRGALPELAGFVFVPLILLLAHRAAERPRVATIAALGLAHGAYLMTHFPVSYLLTITLGVYAVAWAWRERDVRIALRIIGGMAWGLAASSVYWLVALIERKHVREPFSTQFPYHDSYLTLAHGDAFMDMLNASFVVLALALIAALVVTRGSKSLFCWFAIATMFAVTPYAKLVDWVIPNVNVVSFAWRWMVIAALFVALVVAQAIEERRGLAIALVAIAFVMNIGVSVRLMIRAFDNPNLDAPLSYVEWGFVPGRSGDPEKLPADAPPARLDGRGSVEVVKWEPLRREVVVHAADESVLRLRTYRFRGWTARVDGRRTELGIDEFGGQVLRLHPGEHRVIVTFENPRTRQLLGALSALAVFAALIAFGVRRP
jgi:uncharacterized membrane protein